MKYYPIMSEIWLWMHFIDFIYHQKTKSGNQGSPNPSFKK